MKIKIKGRELRIIFGIFWQIFHSLKYLIIVILFVGYYSVFNIPIFSIFVSPTSSEFKNPLLFPQVIIVIFIIVTIVSLIFASSYFKMAIQRTFSSTKTILLIWFISVSIISIPLCIFTIFMANTTFAQSYRYVALSHFYLAASLIILLSSYLLSLQSLLIALPQKGKINKLIATYGLLIVEFVTFLIPLTSFLSPLGFSNFLTYLVFVNFSNLNVLLSLAFLYSFWLIISIAAIFMLAKSIDFL